ncbi:MAG: cell envelope integrity EipB family protein [Alphaproteobacteria bacterium]|nr:cell envelope integrity EipB family protein [Alphaproteobacteria bacterium]
MAGEGSGGVCGRGNLPSRWRFVSAAAAGVTAVVMLGTAAAMLAPASAAAAEIAPHRALYTMTLGTTRNDSGVADAQGTMSYEWGETCDGWTIEQRYRLKMRYAESDDVDIASNFVTWEAKDGLRYRFNQKEKRNGDVDEEIRGEAKLDGPGKGGTATFEKPQPQTLNLPVGTLFPSAHTILLIDSAHQGENFISRQVFDGSTAENAVQVSAVIGPPVPPDPDAGKKSALLQRPGWRVRLAFFPADASIEKPDYELGMRLLDNGVSQDMTIDYGDYQIRAKLDDIETLPRPGC